MVTGDSGVDAMTVDGPPDDVDGDGVKNVMDNCPNKANTNQANEDSDMFGDVCDPCPPFGGAADNMDSDGDGVGNSCDPSQTTGGNAIAMFTGFADTTVPPGASMAGNWTFTGGQAVIDNPQSQIAVLVWPQPTGPAETVMARFTITNMYQEPMGAGVVTQLDAASTRGIACWVFKPDAAQLGTLNLFSINDTSSQGPSSADTLMVNKSYRPDMTRRMSAYSCSESSAANNLNANFQIQPTNPQVGILAMAVSARVEWVLIVTGP
jgi:hypothetical protein